MIRVNVGIANRSHLDDIVALQLELGKHHHKLEPENPRYLIPEDDWRDQIQSAMSEGKSLFLVATQDDELCGFVRISMVKKPWGLSCEMDTLVVAESHRGNGIGALLVEAAEREARSLGARAMRTNVLFSNPHGQKFYKASGYSEIAVRFGKSLE